MNDAAPSSPSPGLVPTKAKNSLVRLVVAVLLVAAAGVMASRAGMLKTLNPPRYDLPENVSSEQERAIKVVQDRTRDDKGRFIVLEETAVFENAEGNHRVCGTSRNPFASGKAIFVYEAIVDANSYEIIKYDSR